MRKKYLAYIGLPLMGFAVLGVSAASAHGWFGFGLSNATPEETAQRQTQIFEQQASLLGISVDDIKNYWAQGKTLSEIAQEKGMNQDQLKAKLQEQRKQQMSQHLQTLVQQGVITQSQADQRLKVMEQAAQNGKGMMRGFGRGMHY